MRKLTAGNKFRFSIFTIIIISIIVILIVFLSKVLNFENEEYAITKDMYIYDKNYEYIELKGDAIIKKKWTGNYYLSEPEIGTSYNLGPVAIAYNAIKNNISLYGTFYEIALDGQVTKNTKNTDITDMLNSKLYKIEDRKYLLVSKEITTENSSLTAENYLIIIIDKGGNTLLLNNNMDIKTINKITLITDSFKFDVANEKLLCNKEVIDLKKVIGSTNQYIEKEENSGKYTPNGTSQVNVGRSAVNSYSTSKANGNGTTVVNPQSTQSNNVTDVVKNASLRSVIPGINYIDVNYIITDPENRYQVVYIKINGGNMVNTIALDKTLNTYRIKDLKPNTDYKLELGYKLIKSDNQVEEFMEDVLNVRTEKISGEFTITKITPDKIYFNLKLDSGREYKNSIINTYINGTKIGNSVKVNQEQVITSSGWNSSIDRTDEIAGKLTLKLENIENVDLSTSTQIY